MHYSASTVPSKAQVLVALQRINIWEWPPCSFLRLGVSICPPALNPFSWSTGTYSSIIFKKDVFHSQILLRDLQSAIDVIQVWVHFLLNIVSCSIGMSKAEEFIIWVIFSRCSWLLKIIWTRLTSAFRRFLTLCCMTSPELSSTKLWKAHICDNKTFIFKAWAKAAIHYLQQGIHKEESNSQTVLGIMQFIAEK